MLQQGHTEVSDEEQGHTYGFVFSLCKLIKKTPKQDKTKTKKNQCTLLAVWLQGFRNSQHFPLSATSDIKDQ